jgi:hypothetical protein
MIHKINMLVNKMGKNGPLLTWVLTIGDFSPLFAIFKGKSAPESRGYWIYCYIFNSNRFTRPAQCSAARRAAAA